MNTQLEKVKEYIETNIAADKFTPGSRLPSENELVKILSVSRSTVNRALRELVLTGTIKRRQGLGTFVPQRTIPASLLEIRSIADEIAMAKGVYSAKVCTLQEVKAGIVQAKNLSVAEGSKIYYSLILHYKDNIPLQLAERYVNPAFAPDYIKQDFSKTTPSKYLFSLGSLTEAEHTIEAIVPDTSLKDFLQIADSEACLILHRRTWSEDTVVTYAKLMYPASKFKPSTRFKNNQLQPLLV